MARGLIFSVRPCLAARLSRRVSGVPRAPGVSPSWSQGWFRPAIRTGGPAGGATAAAISGAHGQRSASRSRRRRPPRTRRQAAEPDDSKQAREGPYRALPAKTVLQPISGMTAVSAHGQARRCWRRCELRLEIARSEGQRTGAETRANTHGCRSSRSRPTRSAATTLPLAVAIGVPGLNAPPRSGTAMGTATSLGRTGSPSPSGCTGRPGPMRWPRRCCSARATSNFLLGRSCCPGKPCWLGWSPRCANAPPIGFTAAWGERDKVGEATRPGRPRPLHC